jgi:hypothetical protein
MCLDDIYTGSFIMHGRDFSELFRNINFKFTSTAQFWSNPQFGSICLFHSNHSNCWSFRNRLNYTVINQGIVHDAWKRIQIAPVIQYLFKNRCHNQNLVCRPVTRLSVGDGEIQNWPGFPFLLWRRIKLMYATNIF